MQAKTPRKRLRPRDLGQVTTFSVELPNDLAQRMRAFAKARKCTLRVVAVDALTYYLQPALRHPSQD